MFATLAGAYPRTPLPGMPFHLRSAHGQLERGEIDEAAFRGVQDDLVRELLAEQLDAGLGLLTDGHVRREDGLTAIAAGLDGFEITGLLRYFDTNTYFRQPRATTVPEWHGPMTVDDWRFADHAAKALAAVRGEDACPVKACLTGPYTLGRLSDPGDVGRERLTLGLAEALNAEARALRDAGAPVIQFDEDALTLAGSDQAEWTLVADAYRRLADDLEGAHLSLAVTMGAMDRAGAATIFDAPFSSYLFDLVAGPDNWYVIAEAPTTRGIVCGVADARNTRPDDEPVMIWAAHYAASTKGRGLDRVGIAPSTSLEYLPRDRARAKIVALGAAAAKGALTDPDELGMVIDPRATDARSAALGEYVPPDRRPGATARSAR